MAQAPDGRARTWLPDPAWLFLVAGIGAIGSGVLIPAAESLADARYQRDVALTWESERLDRLSKHEAYLESVLAREPATIAQLRAMQLNEYPTGLTPLGTPSVDPGLASASVFAMLEPEPHTPPTPPAHRTDRSRLARWATGERSRLWLMAGGAICLLLGVMPRSGQDESLAEDATVPV